MSSRTKPAVDVEAWRRNLPTRCPHVPDWERNPDRRANLCLLCRRDAGDPYAARVLHERHDATDELARRRGGHA